MAFKSVKEANEREAREKRASYERNERTPMCYNCMWYRSDGAYKGVCTWRKVNQNGPLVETKPGWRCDRFSPSSFSSPLRWSR